MKRFVCPSVTLAFLTLSFAGEIYAQTEPKEIIPTGSFLCGVCPFGYALINGAGWNICHQQTTDRGFDLRNVCFNGQKVLFEASQPFVLVDYHAVPPGGAPSPTFKDGVLPLIPQCGGASYRLISGPFAAVGLDDDNPGYPASSGFPAGPAYTKVQLSAIYDAVFYRYRQLYVFHGTGDVELLYGFGGFLFPSDRGRGHFHSPYWRLDFDLDNFLVNYFEEFTHPSLFALPPGLSGIDTWTGIPTSGGIAGDPSAQQKYRVRSDTTNTQGELHSWEIEPILGNSTEFSNFNVVPMVFRGANLQGQVVGSFSCDDGELDFDPNYGNNPPGDNINGADLVVWVSATGHHEARHRGEEGPVRMPGFEYVGVRLSPRNFLNSTPTF